MGWGQFISFSVPFLALGFGSYYYITRDSYQTRIKRRVETSMSPDRKRRAEDQEKQLKEHIQKVIRMKKNLAWVESHEPEQLPSKK